MKKITNLGVKVIKKENKSFGGGGSHQCMKNVYAQGPRYQYHSGEIFIPAT